MKAEAEAIVAALPGVTAARANMTADVSARGGFGRQDVPGIRNIIAVGAGKGGVGKSTTAVNLAVALHRKGARVGLMDADVYGPNIPQMLGITGAARGRATTKRIIPPEAHGIKVISMGMLVPADQPIIWRGPMLHGAVQQFMRDVEWGELDYLVVDLPPGTGDVSLSMAQSVPVAGAVVVTTPQGVSVSDVRKAVAMFRQLNIPVLGVVENMSYFVCGHCQERTEIFGHGGGATMAEDMEIPFLGEVPIDTRVRSGGDEGAPIVGAAPDAPGGEGLLRPSRATWPRRSPSRTCGSCGSSRRRSPGTPSPSGWRDPPPAPSGLPMTSARKTTAACMRGPTRRETGGASRLPPERSAGTKRSPSSRSG